MAQEELQDFCSEIDSRFLDTRRTSAVDWCIFVRIRRNYDADSSRAGILARRETSGISNSVCTTGCNLLSSSYLRHCKDNASAKAREQEACRMATIHRVETSFALVSE